MRAYRRIMFFTILCLAGGISSFAQDVRIPRLNEGRFWLYRNSSDLMPFIPYGVMPEEVGKAKMLTMSVKCTDNPHVVSTSEDSTGKAQTPASGAPAKRQETCISMKIAWDSPHWFGVCFISGPDAPEPWWGLTKTEGVKYYDLRNLPKKHLVFWARGETGKERIQVKMGILGDKPFGDSVKLAPETRWLKLSPQWARYELDLSSMKPEALRAICNGFTLVCSRVEQDDPETLTTTFYLDDIYYE